MDSEQYWARRADERERYWHKKSQETIEKELARYYASSLDEIQKDIQALYGRFAKDNQLSMTDARKLLQGPEFRKWRYTIDTYVKKIGAGEAGLLKELNTLAMRSRISRLDKLYADTLMELDSLGRKTDSAMKSFLTDAYKDNYFHGMYEIGRTMGLKAPRVAVTNQSLEDVLRNRWSGKNYSERIWKNQKLLGRTLQQEMTAAIHRGESVSTISKRIANQMNVATSHATRLVRTELNYVENMAALRSVKDAGMHYYRFMATLDSRTTDICRSHDGSIISVEEASPGDNLPPLHPNCRSTIAGSIYGPDDDHKRGGTRIARTAEGKNYYVPADMTYPEWEEKYVVQAQTLPKNPHAGKAVLVDIATNGTDGNTVKVYEGEKIPRMSADGNEIDWPAPNPDNIITREQYKELRDYASAKGISLSGFRKFDGDVDLIKESIDTLNQNLMEFPEVVDAKHPLTLALIHALNSDDFAITNGRIISINANAFRSKTRLEEEYQKAVDAGWFVKGTDYKSILDHEFGHVLDFVYKINAQQILEKLLHIKDADLYQFLYDSVSQYCAFKTDGTEITSELLAALRSGRHDSFILKYFENYRKIIKKGVLL